MPAATTPDRLRECLNEVDFPADKDGLLAAATRHGCDEPTERALRSIQPEVYQNMSEVLAAVPLADDEHNAAQRSAAYREHTKPGRAQDAKDVGAQSPITEELGENRYS